MSDPSPASDAPVRTHHGACNLCEAICGLEFKVQGRQILSIKGDAADPLSRGHICPKAVALRDLYEDPDRLRTPLRRTADGWQPLGWDEAFDLVADQLAAIIQAGGGDAVATYLGNPSVHNYGHLTHAPALLRQFRSRNRFSATSVDQLPAQLVAYWLYGHQLLLPIPDLDHTQYFLVFGANPMASNGSLMTVPDFRQRIRALQARGGKLVVFDPRRSETAEIADAHHFIRPGSDVWLLLAMLQTLFAEGLTAPGRLSAWLDGLDAVAAAVAPFTPERAAEKTGVPADIRRIARELAAAPAAVCYGRMGVSVQAHGTLCQWAIQVLNLVTGHFDQVGGALFTRPALDLVDSPVSRPGHFGKWKSRVSGLPEFAGELPVAALAEEILTPGAGQVRGLITIAGNPVLSTPNGVQVDRALESLAFMVSVDIYLNETTRHADVILPPTSALEHDHYDLIFHHFAVRNTARYSQPLFEKPADARHDWEILSEVGRRLGERLGQPSQPLPRPDQIVDMGLQAGPHGAARRDSGSAVPALSLKTLKAHPHGVDLGPLQPSLPARLRTAGQRIACAVPEVLAALAQLDASVAQDPGGLRLIGRRHLRSNNSWMHNSERLVKGPRRNQLLMHPDDLVARGLTDGALVRVRSRVGEIQVEVKASAEMMRGVVSLPHGWGHGREGVRLGVASAQGGASINDVTDERALDAVSGNAALNGLSVEVSAT
jgi:anaerobic selenocysteine-containing dehydrogenase